jgi:hypothetical protein
MDVYFGSIDSSTALTYTVSTFTTFKSVDIQRLDGITTVGESS